MNKKTKKKSEQYAPFCSILPICTLVGILSAVLVTLIFSIAFVQSFKFETKPTYSASGAFKEAIANNKKDDNSITLLNGEAVVDFFVSSKSGFIYAANEDCGICTGFGKALAKAAVKNEVTDIYHYEYDLASTEKADVSAREVTVGQEEAPVLIYVKNGHVYDRLDDPSSESDLGTFLAKYK